MSILLPVSITGTRLRILGEMRRVCANFKAEWGRISGGIPQSRAVQNSLHDCKFIGCLVYAACLLVH